MFLIKECLALSWAENLTNIGVVFLPQNTTSGLQPIGHGLIEGPTRPLNVEVEDFIEILLFCSTYGVEIQFLTLKLGSFLTSWKLEKINFDFDFSVVFNRIKCLKYQLNKFPSFQPNS